MKIINITTHRLTAPLKTPFITALRRVDRLEDIVVIVQCDNGTCGYGEGAPTPVITGETIDTMLATIAYIKPHLIGRDIEDFQTILTQIQTLIRHNTTAKSALEIALYDLKAKIEKQPLYQMLGGTQTSFQTDITISMNPIETMIQESLQAIQRGYTILKIKIGSNPKVDIERITTLHEVLGKEITLRLDANQGWTAKQSVTLLQEIEKRGITPEFIEQPVEAHDIAGLHYIKARVQTPILADESIFSLHDARRLLELEAIDYVNIKLAKTAGITQALQLADLSASFGIKCMIGCMLEGPISVATAVHVASAKAETITMLDLDAVALLKHHPVETKINFEESRITLSQEHHGLGVDFKTD